MKKFLYGAGRILERYRETIDWSAITGVIDASVSGGGGLYNGKTLISPNDFVFKNEYLYIISSVKYYWEIRAHLMEEYKINSSQIVGLLSWLDNSFLSVDFKTSVSTYEAIEEVFYCLGKLGAESILSCTDCFAQYGVLSLSDKRLKRWYKTEKCIVDCCISEGNIANIWPYNKMSVGLTEKYYDAIICMEGWGKLKQAEKDLLLTEKNCKYLLMTFRFGEHKEMEKCKKETERYGQVKNLSGYGIGWILILEYKDNKNVGLYVVTHKEIKLPFIHSGCGFNIIFAGAYEKNSYEYLRDDINDNISYLNPWLNECTALYWMWKHSDEKIIGLCHYRRFFLFGSAAEKCSDNILYPLEAETYLKTYDIIVLESWYGGSEYGMYTLLASGVKSHVLEKGMEIVRRLLKRFQPDYVEIFEIVLHGVNMYPCNMFITRKEILNKYCTWLFSFIIDAAKEVSTLGYEGNDKRVIGFIAERMLTVWLLKQHLKIKELPMYFLSDK